MNCRECIDIAIYIQYSRRSISDYFQHELSQLNPMNCIISRTMPQVAPSSPLVTKQNLTKKVKNHRYHCRFNNNLSTKFQFYPHLWTVNWQQKKGMNHYNIIFSQRTFISIQSHFLELDWKFNNTMNQTSCRRKFQWNISTLNPIHNS